MKKEEETPRPAPPQKPLPRLRGFKVILGCHGFNTLLRKEGVLVERTARQDTILAQGKKGMRFLQELTRRNLEDLYRILVWNVEHGIRFFRMGSGLCPHITNPLFLGRRPSLTTLAYSLEPFREIFQRIGDLARTHGLRLTFHPGQFDVLSSPDPRIIQRTIRDLHYHATLFQMMGLDSHSVMIVHGGGTYGDKPSAIRRFVENYRRLPPHIKKHLVVENDEYSYGVLDVLEISKLARTPDQELPVVLDVFHHEIYSSMPHPGEPNPPLQKLMDEVVESWGSREVKMHIAEQNPGHARGSHAQFVERLPKLLLEFPSRYRRNLWLMIEAKQHEQALLHLRQKYPETA